MVSEFAGPHAPMNTPIGDNKIETLFYGEYGVSGGDDDGEKHKLDMVVVIVVSMVCLVISVAEAILVVLLETSPGKVIRDYAEKVTRDDIVNVVEEHFGNGAAVENVIGIDVGSVIGNVLGAKNVVGVRNVVNFFFFTFSDYFSDSVSIIIYGNFFKPNPMSEKLFHINFFKSCESH